MAKYDPKSRSAEDFINDEEIRETLDYAAAHARDVPLIESLLEKARPRLLGNGCHCAGLTHREASVLLAMRLSLTPPPIPRARTMRSRPRRARCDTSRRA